MTGQVAPADRAACLALAQRQVGDASDWTADQWDAQLGEDGLLLGDPAALYFRPYRTALAYAVRPNQVKQRTEGQVSEQYVDPAALAARLRELDLEWTALRLPGREEDDGDPGAFTGDVKWGGW